MGLVVALGLLFIGVVFTILCLHFFMSSMVFFGFLCLLCAILAYLGVQSMLDD